MSGPKVGGLVITDLGLIAHSAHSLSADSSHEALAEQAARLEGLATGPLQRLREVRTSRSLTPVGRSEANAEIRAETEADPAWRREAERVEAARAEAEERRATLLSRRGGWLTPRDISEERAEDLAREVRDRLEARRASMSEDDFRREVRRMADEAARSDDRVVLRAIETAPLALLPEEALDEVRELHSRSVAPERWERADELAALADLFSGNLSRALRQLADRAGIRPDV